MDKSDIKFTQLVSEMEELLLVRAPAIKKEILIFKNKERNEESNYYDEITKKEIELEGLRKDYLLILSNLKQIDLAKTKMVVAEVVKKQEELETNYTSDLRNAKIKQDRWFGKKPAKKNEEGSLPAYGE